MPFICLANQSIPDGVLQITDLFPDVSQNNNPTNPPGQGRYLRRPGTDQPMIDPTTGNVVGIPAESNLATFAGLAAYLVDKVEPGSLAQATADIILAVNPIATDVLIINGVIHVAFTAGANDATTAATVGDPFIVQIAGSAALTGDNLDTVLTDAAAIVTMRGLNANIFPDSTNVAGTVTFDALFTGGGPQLGVTGDMTLTLAGAGAATRITLPVPARLARAGEAWDQATIVLAVDAVQARVDGGLGLTLANINTALAAAGADLTGAAASSASVGTLVEFLSVMAGRTYSLPAASNKFTAAVAPDTAHVWLTALLGSFTVANTVFDTQMLGGEISPVLIAGDVVQNEVGGIRSTYDTTAFQVSLTSGQLAQFAAGVTLFPDNDIAPFIATAFQPGPLVAEITGARLVTVYDDDGSLLI